MHRFQRQEISRNTISGLDFVIIKMEIIASQKKPSEIRDMLINIASYVILEDVILHDGETVGMSATQRLKITKSEGVNVEGEILKIQF